MQNIRKIDKVFSMLFSMLIVDPCHIFKNAVHLENLVEIVSMQE